MAQVFELASLPALRQELSLYPGPIQDDGSPSWTLHDPSANRFYRLGWASFEMLARWSLGRVDAVVAAVRGETTLAITAEDVQALVEFLRVHQLVRSDAPADSARLWWLHCAQQPGKARWLLQNYLFFRIPLLRPEPLLARLAPIVRVFFQPLFWRLLPLLVLGVGWMLVQHWDGFTHSFAGYKGWDAALGVVLSLSLAKCVHELGHALTARHFGCRVPTMGVAFLVMAPVLYTDTNDAWKLPQRRSRLLIAGAGIVAELLLALLATALWCQLGEGPLRAAVLLLASTTWLATLAVNASPFMRFDGYFLLSDWLGIPNLHAHAFALARWQLRRQVLGLDDPPPESLPPGRRRALIAFALLTWVYRLVLFLGIAFLVYRMFFKALGLILLGVELGWFIARPIVGELRAWWQLRDRFRWRGRSIRALASGLGLLAFLACPLPGAVSGPALLKAAQAQAVYAPSAGVMRRCLVRDGETVAAGQLLLRLESPALQTDLAVAHARERSLAVQVASQPFDPELQAVGSALDKDWQVARQQVARLEDELRRLEIRAPIGGVVRDLSEALKPGTVLAEGEPLLEIVDPRGVRGEAFVDEAARAEIRDGQPVRFVADSGEGGLLRCRVGLADSLSMAVLDEPVLASTHGGRIAAELHGQQLVPVEALFRVRFDHCDQSLAPPRERTGIARIEGSRRSLAGRALRSVWASG